MHAVPTHAASPERLPFYRQLYFQVVVAIVAGVLLGTSSPSTPSSSSRWATPSSSW